MDKQEGGAMSELLRQVAEIVAGEFPEESPVEIATRILAAVAGEVEKTIVGQYPQGNSYADQMERVLSLIKELKEEP